LNKQEDSINETLHRITTVQGLMYEKIGVPELKKGPVKV